MNLISLSLAGLLKHWVALRSINYFVIYIASLNELMYVVALLF
jgi:hypothetical protein